MSETTARPRLYLIDGYSNIFRAFYAIRNLSNSRGEPTNAVYGFIQMLRKLLREDKPDLVGVALDVGKTFRNEKFEDYKANRAPMPEDLQSQIPWIRRVLEAYRIPALELQGYEADDVLGSIACRAAEAGYDVVLVSADKDLMQLVDAPRLPLPHRPQQAVRPGRRGRGLRRAAGEGGGRPGPDGRLDRQHPRRARHRREGRQGADPGVRLARRPPRPRRGDHPQGLPRRAPASTTSRRACRRSCRPSTSTCDIPFDPEALRHDQPDAAALRSAVHRAGVLLPGRGAQGHRGRPKAEALPSAEEVADLRGVGGADGGLLRMAGPARSSSPCSGEERPLGLARRPRPGTSRILYADFRRDGDARRRPGDACGALDRRSRRSASPGTT